MRHLPRPPKPVQELAILAEQPRKRKSMEQGNQKMPRSKSRKIPQLQRNRQNKEKQKVVERRKIVGCTPHTISICSDCVENQENLGFHS